MKITIRTDVITRALFHVQGVADKKSTMPVLSHVLLQADEEGLTVSGTDLDVGISGRYEADVSEPGSAVVHAKQAYEIVRSLSGDKVELSLGENKWVQIKSAQSSFELVGMPADEFPALPSHAQMDVFEIAAGALLEMIDRSIFCASTDDNRHNLNGVYCESPAENTLRMVATDGHRLALSERKFDIPINLEKGVIVPRKGFQELRRVLGDVEDKNTLVQIGFSGSNGILRVGHVELSTRLVEGVFPDYGQVIPQNSACELKIGRGAFAEALRRVSLLSQGRNHGVKLTVTKGNLELAAEDPQYGHAEENIPIEFDGEGVTVGFNARYILDVLSLVKEDSVRFSISDDLSPGVIRSATGDDFLAVVMPMRI